jgi:serine/threonine protein kinase
MNIKDEIKILENRIENLSINEEINVKKEISSKKFLDAGTYGKVYSISDTMVVKSQKLFEVNNLNTICLKEICALSQYSHKYMINITDIKITSKVRIYMEKCMSLQNLINNTSKTILLQKLPKIVSQIIEVLYYFENINKVHADLSTNNITFDKNGDIKIIDYGSFSFNPPLIKEILCTYIFCSPECQPGIFDNKDPKTSLSPKLDIFSLGIIIKYIIFNHYDEQHLIKSYYLMGTKEFTSNYLEAPSSIDKEFISLWRKMLKMNQTDRISASELYHSEYFTKIRKSYKNNENKENKENKDLINKNMITTFLNRSNLDKLKDIKFRDINLKMRQIFIYWLYELSIEFKINEVLGLAIHILDIYLSKNIDIDRSDLQCLGCAVLAISESLIYGLDTNLSEYHIMSDKSVKISSLKKMITNVLQSLNYNLYYYTFDQELFNDEKKIDIKTIAYICNDHNNSGKSNKQLISIYKNLINDQTLVNEWIKFNKKPTVLV